MTSQMNDGYFAETTALLKRYLASITYGVKDGNPQVTQTLAVLRRESHLPVGEAPRTWSLASRICGHPRSRTPTKPEVAVGIVLGLHAINPRDLCTNGRSIGELIGDLDGPDELSPRLRALTAAASVRVLSHVLRSVIRMSAQRGVAAPDMVHLFRDLVTWQDPARRRAITARWARDAARIQLNCTDHSNTIEEH